MTTSGASDDAVKRLSRIKSAAVKSICLEYTDEKTDGAHGLIQESIDISMLNFEDFKDGSQICGRENITV